MFKYIMIARDGEGYSHDLGLGLNTLSKSACVVLASQARFPVSPLEFAEELQSTTTIRLLGRTQHKPRHTTL